MTIHPSFRSRFLFPLEFPDAGTGSGGGTGTGTGAGTGTGTGGTSSGQPISGAGGSGGGQADRTVYDFSKADSAYVRTQDGRELSYKDWEKERDGATETRYKGNYQKAYSAILDEAKKIDEMRASMSRPNRGAGDGQPDPFAEYDGMAVVDGPAIRKLVGQLKSMGLDPIAKMVADQQKTISQMQTQLKGMGQHVGTQNEERASAQFDERIDKTLSDAQIKGLSGPVDTKDPAIREFARNLYLSYEPNSWKVGEFEKMLGDQLSAIVMGIRRMDKAHSDGASDRLRQHFDPTKGSGSPRGGGRYQHETPREIAAKARAMGMFGGGTHAT